MVFRNKVVHTVRLNNKQVRFDSVRLRFWFLIQLSVQLLRFNSLLTLQHDLAIGHPFEARMWSRKAGAYYTILQYSCSVLVQGEIYWGIQKPPWDQHWHWTFRSCFSRGSDSQRWWSLMIYIFILLSFEFQRAPTSPLFQTSPAGPPEPRRLEAPSRCFFFVSGFFVRCLKWTKPISLSWPIYSRSRVAFKHFFRQEMAVEIIELADPWIFRFSGSLKMGK